ncbi:MAG: tRNA uridine-5-carboxymethylaminomethyl(34) synthesis GTPase MnmE [Prevotella sp.]|nr:tRNA uridine-5-carboxymethylaminomethyl(34) synthesis GTPase MnmE [Prevotella sp.]
MGNNNIQTSNHDSTICAPATAPGGAIAIIRISGPQALPIVSSICSVKCEKCKPNTIHYTHIKDDNGETIDEVLISIFKNPCSFTGEDSAEISCHGSRYIINKVLELLIQHGCRMAHLGEFTQRAYLNGKMDLSQAEAVADLIASTNQATHRLAMSQLRGHFSSELSRLRDQLLRLTSLLELELDFSDHEELEFADRTQLLSLTHDISQHITTLAHSFETGQAIKNGIPVAIVGKTNVGKSTLLNALLKDDRAIVSDVHGTTRDTIEDTIDINGVTFRFIDTAGLRQTTDVVEQIGIERTYQAIDKARIVIWLIDELPTDSEFNDITQRCKGKTLITAFNKSDIKETSNLSSDAKLRLQGKKPQISNLNPLNLSAKTGYGVEPLKQHIYEASHLPDISEDDVIVTNARHYAALLHAEESIQRVLDGFTLQLTGDLLAEDLRLALNDLAEITGGQITPQETLNNIFSHFCVGK